MSPPLRKPARRSEASASMKTLSIFRSRTPRGQFHSFAKSELKEVRRLRGETPMPSYEASLSAAELDDLVAYLASLKGKS